jgi:hypothetical protein
MYWPRILTTVGDGPRHSDKVAISYTSARQKLFARSFCNGHITWYVSVRNFVTDCRIVLRYQEEEELCTSGPEVHRGRGTV